MRDFNLNLFDYDVKMRWRNLSPGSNAIQTIDEIITKLNERGLSSHYLLF